MTQIAFLKKADTPSRQKIQESINSLGYDFTIMDDFESIYTIDGLTCKIDGHETYFEAYFSTAAEIAKDNGWMKSDLTDQDMAISFVWGADFAAGACIGLISIALIDNCGALIYYMDDEMKCTKEMLLSDTPQFLIELEKSRDR